MGTHTFTQGPGRFVKLAAAVFGAVASAVVAMGLTGGRITTAEWLNIVIAGIGAIHVWYVTETSDNPNGKAVLAALTAGLITLQSFVTTSMHVNLTMWMQVGLAALTATGIWAAPSLAKTQQKQIRFMDPAEQTKLGVGYLNARYGDVVLGSKISTGLTGARREITSTGVIEYGPDKAPRPQDLP